MAEEEQVSAGDGTAAAGGVEPGTSGVPSASLADPRVLSLSTLVPASSLIREVGGAELSVEYLQKHGFERPLLVRDAHQLDLRVPNAKFGVGDVRAAVGSRRTVEAVDRASGATVAMTMKDWHKYFEAEDRSEVLNVVSLEFSNTKLDAQVVSPRIVRQLDWIDRAWPRHLKELQIEPSNNVDDMMYPKVRRSHYLAFSLRAMAGFF